MGPVGSIWSVDAASQARRSSTSSDPRPRPSASLAGWAGVATRTPAREEGRVQAKCGPQPLFGLDPVPEIRHRLSASGAQLYAAIPP